jgi:hypothetical protein
MPTGPKEEEGEEDHIWQSQNMKLFGEQRRSETARPLQFLELIKTTFDCGGNTRQ